MVDSNQRPRASRLQFSLRAVLVLLTFAAIAGWWWQKRYRVESTVKRKRLSDEGIEVVELKKTESMRRQGLDNVVRDGPTTIADSEGKLISEEQWRQGRRHGIYRRWDENEQLLFECEFKRGKLIRVGENEVQDFIYAAEASDESAGPRILRALHGDTHFSYLNQQLQHIIEDIKFNHNIPLVIDTPALDQLAIATDTRITAEILQVPLFVALTELLAPLKLTCAYRYEVLWITTAESALFDQQVPTVVLDKASPELVDALSHEASFDYLDQPLASVLEDVAFNHNIDIKADLIDPTEPITKNLKGISLGSALGVLFHLHGLRGKAEGDSLVVADAEGKIPRPRRATATTPAERPVPPAQAPSTSAPSDSADPFSKEAPSEDPFSRR